MRPRIDFTLSELAIPTSLTDPSAAAFTEMVALANGISRHTWGNDDFVYSAEAQLPGFLAQEFNERLTFVARVDGLIVGRLIADFPLDQEAVTVTLAVEVAPVVRGNGIGSALLAKGEELALDGGRTVAIVYTEHPAAQLTSKTPLVFPTAGPAGIPAHRPEVRFLSNRGYTLGQVERTSELKLPFDEARLAGILREASTAAGPEYALIHWWRHAPEEYVDRFAALRTHMSSDVPQAGVALDAEVWDAGRIRHFEQLMVDRGEPLLTSVALHIPTGELVAYTDLVVPDAGKVEQHDTLVISAHRGRRLGTLVKAENIRQLASLSPASPAILTWNAFENEHMLAVNDVFGFVLHGLDGNWQKNL
jgi:GNAT superfamily N-acetyltransferase